MKVKTNRYYLRKRYHEIYALGHRAAAERSAKILEGNNEAAHVIGQRGIDVIELVPRNR